MTQQLTNQYLYGDSKRLFLNTNLGCHAKCSYCYLPSLNVKIGENPANTISVNDLIFELNHRNDFIKGKYGTILSLGCYSECWDTRNRKDTIELINILLQYENPIQVATKEYITQNDFSNINTNAIKYKHHLSLFISSSTITKYKKYEKGTMDPKLRFHSFELQELYNVPMYLYIKPVLKNITIKDIDKYIEIIQRYNINAVVGKKFSKDGDILAPIAEGELFYNNKQDDYEILVNILLKYCNIFQHSDQAIMQGITDG